LTKLKEKNMDNVETKKLLENSTDDSLRVQVTNRLQRLCMRGLLDKHVVSPKNVQYSIKLFKKAREQIDREVFKQSLRGLRFQRVPLDTKKIVEKSSKHVIDSSKKHLISLDDKWKLRDRAKSALYEAMISESGKIFSKFCKVYVIYPINVPEPSISDNDIEEFYRIFLAKSISRENENVVARETGFSIIFQHDPIPKIAEKQFEEACVRAWLKVMGVEDPEEPISKHPNLPTKYREDYKFVNSLLKKSIERIEEKTK